MKIKVGDIVDNKGNNSKFRGQRGTVVKTGIGISGDRIRVQYPCGQRESHPAKILYVVRPMDLLPEDLFTL